jgi:uncharacterized protein YutE (UPF0331/DUF86 family)
MKKMMTAMLAFFATSTTLKETTLDGSEPLELSADQKAEIDKHFDAAGVAEKFMNEYNKQTAAQSDNDQAKKLAQQFLAEDASTDEEEVDAMDDVEEEDAEDQTASAAVKKLVARVVKLEATNQSLIELNEKLANAPDVTPTEKITGKIKQGMKHSATHLFGSNASYNAFEKRSWNENVKAVMAGTPIDKIEMSNWGSRVVVDQLNEDLGDYARQHSREIIDLLMDGMMLPDHWEFITGVSDEIAFANITSGEVTQSWKAAFLPKNKQEFAAVINKIFDIQIDALWTPKDLKSIEKNFLREIFNEGSDPYKPVFAAYLIQKLLAKARKEDKISLFKGVHYKNVDRNVAGSYLNTMDGYFKLIDNNRNVTFRTIDTPRFTPENTYDVITDLVENKLPYDMRVNANTTMEIGTEVMKWYHDGRELKKGSNTDYTAITGIEGRPNITLVAVAQFEGTGLWTLFPTGTVGWMVDRPGEESNVIIEKQERNLKGMVDYKMGPFVKAFGAEQDPDNPTYENQIFFCNDVPLLTDTYVPTAANDATPSVATHHALRVGQANTAATNITNIDDIAEGQFVYLYGDADANVSTVKNGANIILDDGDFILAKGNKITLVGLAGGKAIEVERYVSGSVAPVQAFVLAADATTANAENGNRFQTVANSAATEFTDIVGAVKGNSYTLIGGSDTNPTSITKATAAKFLLTADVSLTDGASVTLYFNGSKFVETARA